MVPRERAPIIGIVLALHADFIAVVDARRAGQRHGRQQGQTKRSGVARSQSQEARCVVAAQQVELSADRLGPVHGHEVLQAPGKPPGTPLTGWEAFTASILCGAINPWAWMGDARVFLFLIFPFDFDQGDVDIAIRHVNRAAESSLRLQAKNFLIELDHFLAIFRHNRYVRYFRSHCLYLSFSGG